MKRIFFASLVLVTTLFISNTITAQERGLVRENENYPNRVNNHRNNEYWERSRGHYEQHRVESITYSRNSGYNRCSHPYYEPRRISYQYFPIANVYYCHSNNMYLYPSERGWVSSSCLPRNIYLNESFQEVYCNENDNIWLYNEAHLQAYRPRSCNRIAFERPRPRITVAFHF